MTSPSNIDQYISPPNSTSPSPETSPSTMSPERHDPLSLPRILCLHGGGTNATILRMQARAFISNLSTCYRLVFADAPFLCSPHPAIIPVYSDYGPFRMWYRWRKDQRRCGGAVDVLSGMGAAGGSGRVRSGSDTDDNDSDRDDDDIITSEMEYQLQTAMDADDVQGGIGEWVGLLGFSQGARVAGSILFDRQLKLEAAGISTAEPHVANDPARNSIESAQSIPGFAGGNWAFAVLIAGQGPFLTLSELGEKSGMTEAPGILPNLKLSSPGSPKSGCNGIKAMSEAHKLTLPTLHIHGLKDGMQPNMRRWYDAQFEKGKSASRNGSGATLIEWNGNHRLPFKSMDMAPIINAIECMGEL